MSKGKQALLVTGIVTASGCVLSLYISLRRKAQDRLATELVREITRQLQPATAGLLSEQAFDVGYTDLVLRGTREKVLTLKPEVARAYADRIHAAWGSWWSGGDDEQKVYSVFRELKDKVQVSQVAQAYLRNQGTHLMDKLNERLDKEEIRTVLGIVRPLPGFRTV